VSAVAAAPAPTFDLTGIAAWPPTRWTRPLDADFASLYERHREMLGRAWYAANGYVLERWQEQLLHAITELTPLGILRYREVLISLGRQNGKTEIAAALGLLFMYHKHSPQVLSIAKNAEQARIVYNRAQKIVKGSAALSNLFAKLTDTRGLKTKRGGIWEIKASKSDALQGIPIDLGIVDEVHLIKGELWDDMVNGLGGRDNCMVVGITTAGNDDSTHLLHLYERAESATFGKFVWEAPEPRMPDDDALLGRWLAMANPSVASGRVRIENVVGDARGQVPGNAIRYRLNRFVSGKDNGYINVPDWTRLLVPGFSDDVDLVRPILTIDRTPDWSYATVVATSKLDDDRIGIQVAKGIPNPTVDALFDYCEHVFGKLSPETFVVDGYSLPSLAKKLKENGYPVRTMSLGDEVSAASMFYSKVVRGELIHGEPGLAPQFQNVIRKATHGDQYKLVRGSGSQSIEAALATVRGVYVAETIDVGGSLVL